MSEFINNNTLRQKKLKEIIMRLHNGEDFETVKADFEKHFSNVTAGEITQMETALVKEGMPVEHIQKLCDVHASVFKGTIEEIHEQKNDEDIPGHPVYTFRKEDQAIEEFIHNEIIPIVNSYSENKKDQLLDKFVTLKEIDKHYARKENLIFPYLEAAGITAPPKVMWGVDDEIRQLIKDTISLLENSSSDEEITQAATLAIEKIKEMIFKDENILLPMAIDTLTSKQWKEVLDSSDEFGYFLVEPRKSWAGPSKEEIVKEVKTEVTTNKEDVIFEAGAMSPKELNALFNTLPLDITFVDKNDKVRFFSQGEERIFPRPKTIIGREVSNCHPPSSVHVVEQIVNDFKSGKKDHEDFWIKMKGMFVYIRYFAVRDENGEYLGVVELTQDIKPIQEIEGEKRLLTE
jgi:DUF438 domain-containing protein